MSHIHQQQAVAALLNRPACLHAAGAASTRPAHLLRTPTPTGPPLARLAVLPTLCKPGPTNPLLACLSLPLRCFRFLRSGTVRGLQLFGADTASLLTRNSSKPTSGIKIQTAAGALGNRGAVFIAPGGRQLRVSQGNTKNIDVSAVAARGACCLLVDVCLLGDVCVVLVLACC